MTAIERYLSRNAVRVRDLLYLCREDGLTVLVLSDGRRLTTHRTVRDFQEHLGTDRFLSVNKGVLVNRDAIASEKDGTLILTDGTRLRLRRGQRTASLCETKEDTLKRIGKRYALLDAHPTAHLLYSLPLFDGESGAVLRYRNRAASDVQARLTEEQSHGLAAAARALLERGESSRLPFASLYVPEDGYVLAVLFEFESADIAKNS